MLKGPAVSQIRMVPICFGASHQCIPNACTMCPQCISLHIPLLCVTDCSRCFRPCQWRCSSIAKLLRTPHMEHSVSQMDSQCIPPRKKRKGNVSHSPSIHLIRKTGGRAVRSLEVTRDAGLTVSRRQTRSVSLCRIAPSSAHWRLAVPTLGIEPGNPQPTWLALQRHSAQEPARARRALPRPPPCPPDGCAQTALHPNRTKCGFRETLEPRHSCVHLLWGNPRSSRQCCTWTDPQAALLRGSIPRGGVGVWGLRSPPPPRALLRTMPG